MKKIVVASCLATVGFAAQAAGFTLESPDIAPNGTIRNEQVFDGFGCTGDNVSPALEWKNAPKEARSFAVLVHDPDTPTGGSGWWHWVVINLPPQTTGLALGAGRSDRSALPAGATQIATDFGGPGWGGPCPPVGDRPHRYRFTVYALKVDQLELPPGATAALAGFLVNANSIGRATLTGRYGRNK